jgi:hypothetical protein
VLSGGALLALRQLASPRCDATPISRRDIELNSPRMKAIPCRRSVTAEGAFQMLFVANAGRRGQFGWFAFVHVGSRRRNRLTR